MIVIDTVHRRIKAEFPLPGLNSVRFLQTKRFLIAQSYESLRAINPETGGTLWDLKTGNAIRTPMFKGGDDQVLIAERESYEQDRKARFDVVALAIETGKPLWRWRGPDGPWGDQVGVTIRPCPAGFAICRHWTILD